MKFVVFNASFLPKAGAESFCTTRFASALADNGHEVHVVTMDWPKDVGNDVYDFLVSKNLKITRVSLRRRSLAAQLARILYRTHDMAAITIPACVKAVKCALGDSRDAILVTRSSPFVSMIVGWYCRKAAKRWVAHFSDPLSHFNRQTMMEKLRYQSMRFWLDRTIRAADGISLTCEAVKRYYRDEHGSVFANTPSFVTNHIGEPKLPTKSIYTDDVATKTIAHSGYLNALRGSEAILAAVESLNRNGLACSFLQCGPVDEITGKKIAEQSSAKMIVSNQPDMATAVCENASAILIADQDTELGYIPFIPSKFAYQIFIDKPIIILTRKGSAMHECSVRYPKAGLFVAEYDKPETLEQAISSALKMNVGAMDRRSLREEFSRQQVASKFVRDVESLG